MATPPSPPFLSAPRTPRLNPTTFVARVMHVSKLVDRPFYCNAVTGQILSPKEMSKIVYPLQSPYSDASITPKNSLHSTTAVGSVTSGKTVTSVSLDKPRNTDTLETVRATPMSTGHLNGPFDAKDLFLTSKCYDPSEKNVVSATCTSHSNEASEIKDIALIPTQVDNPSDTETEKTGSSNEDRKSETESTESDKKTDITDPMWEGHFDGTSSVKDFALVAIAAKKKKVKEIKKELTRPIMAWESHLDTNATLQEYALTTALTWDELKKLKRPYKTCSEEHFGAFDISDPRGLSDPELLSDPNTLNFTAVPMPDHLNPNGHQTHNFHFIKLVDIWNVYTNYRPINLPPPIDKTKTTRQRLIEAGHDPDWETKTPFKPPKGFYDFRKADVPGIIPLEYHGPQEGPMIRDWMERFNLSLDTDADGKYFLQCFPYQISDLEYYQLKAVINLDRYTDDHSVYYWLKDTPFYHRPFVQALDYAHQQLMHWHYEIIKLKEKMYELEIFDHGNAVSIENGITEKAKWVKNQKYLDTATMPRLKLEMWRTLSEKYHLWAVYSNLYQIYERVPLGREQYRLGLITLAPPHDKHARVKGRYRGRGRGRGRGGNRANTDGGRGGNRAITDGRENGRGGGRAGRDGGRGGNRGARGEQRAITAPKKTQS